MKLLFDIGNTFLKWGVYSDEAACVKQGKQLLEAGTLNSSLQDLFKAIETPQQVLIVNVNNNEILQTVVSEVRQAWGLSALIAETSAEACGLKNAYPITKKLGTDRWVAMLGAKTFSSSAYCVVDCGSAITIDYVDAKAHHQGGLILPGLRLMQEALDHNTANLSSSQAESATLQLAQDTESAIRNGCYYATVAVIKQVCDDLSKASDDEIDFFITGGDAETVLKQNLGQDFIHKPDLIFSGLLNLYSET